MNERDPLLYELYYALKAGSPEEAAKSVGVVTGLIEKGHGIIASQSQPDVKMLSYPIRKERDAYAGWVRFMLKPDAAPKLERDLGAESPLLRFMLTRAKKEEAPLESRRRKRIVPAASEPETQAKIEEIDKKLEEILGA
ncbi:MAG: 30S ribosomal protein S6 [Candidatus Niyogibacteria bacterium]|nr:30S ribosomal protein S6 [Candidatus Niyogibacteria bacterium]